MSSKAPKSSLERLLDVAVYAPLGYVLTRRKTRQELIKAGRRQIAFSRSLGQAALRGLSRRSDSSDGDAPAGGQPTPVRDDPAANEIDETPVADEASGESEALESPKSDAPATQESSIDGYDTMTAKEIIALLGDAPSADVLWIQQHEMANKERVTVLRAADRRLRALS